MRAAGVHQGLAPVLDVTRDYRWGRTEETIGEDPYLVGTVGAAYVRGLEGAGVVATLKHFAGYSASRAGRNLAPVSIGRARARRRDPAAVRDGRPRRRRPVRHALLRRDRRRPVGRGHRRCSPRCCATGWGFTGTVVADYFGIRFLQTLHGVAGSRGARPPRLALTAGVDVELPSVHCYGDPLRDAVVRGRRRRGAGRPGAAPRADAEGRARPARPGLAARPRTPRPRPRRRREPRTWRSGWPARRSSCVDQPDGTLPLRARAAGRARRTRSPTTRWRCSAATRSPRTSACTTRSTGWASTIPTVLERAARDRTRDVTYARGCDVDRPRPRPGSTRRVAAARDADVCVVAVGDRAGLFGRGTSGEGCDATDLHLPGVQADLVRALLGTGTPVVLLLLTGRPYALGDAGRPTRPPSCRRSSPASWAGRRSPRCSPGGRRPVGPPAGEPPRGRVRASPAPTCRAPLGRRSGVSSVDPTSAVPVRSRAVVHVVLLVGRARTSDRVGDRRRGRGRGRSSPTRATAPAPTSSSCTCTTRWPR